METTTLIVNKELDEQIKVAILFEDCPFKLVTSIRLSDDRYYINFNVCLSNTTLFQFGIYLAEKNNLPLDQTFIENWTKLL